MSNPNDTKNTEQQSINQCGTDPRKPVAVATFIDDRHRRERTAYLHTIPVGQYFHGEIRGTNGLFLRTFDRVINLFDPAQTWSAANRTMDHVVVGKYEPVAVEVHVTANL